MADSLRLQTLALIGQQFLVQALANGGSLDSAMQTMLLGSSSGTSGKEKSATALTGRIRSDAATLRQGAKNASEGAAMASIINESALSIGETLSEMQTLVQAYQSGQLSDGEAQTAFTSLARNLSATVSGAQYNGISLMDADGWNDERLTVNGSTATLSIQMGASATTFSLHDLSSLKNLESVVLTDEKTADGLLSLTETLSKSLSTASTIASGYQALAGSYTSQAKAMESQAEILSKTAERAVSEAGKHPSDIAAPDTEKTINTILMDMLLRDSGKLVDTSS
ncbi:MAG: hypothetical protein DELT_00079 [Desulfovibrio sp.]